MLKIAVAYEQLREKLPATSVVNRLRDRQSEFDRNLVDTLVDLQPVGPPKQLRKVSTSRLRAGMVLNQEIKNGHGILLVAKGQELTTALILRIVNHAKAGAIDKEVMAFVPS
jgi:hypothetical protein